MAKLTKAQKLALDRLSARGGTLLLDGEGFVDQGGETYHATVIRNLIERGQIQSNNDAMFDTRPQSYRLCQPNG